MAHRVASGAPLGLGGILRLALVQTSLGAIVVLVTATMNRVMVVELALPAVLPGALVGLHYAVQMLRPRLGHGSDVGGRRTPWIIGGMAVLACGGLTVAGAIALLPAHRPGGILLALAGFVLVGLGVSAAGTALLALLARRVAPARRAAAATIVWLMMFAGFALTATLAGHWLQPFSASRLLAVTTATVTAALLLTVLAVWGVEGPAVATADEGAARPAFRAALAQVWADRRARHFTMFIFLSMLAYSAQELLLEPFAGRVFHLPPGASAQLTGLQHGGAFAGMLLVALLGGRGGGAALRGWTIGGCAASAAALLALAAVGCLGLHSLLRPTVAALGIANGAFTVAAIGAMMQLAGAAGEAATGMRIGLWGGAQAIAFALGGLLGTGASDAARLLAAAPATAYALVFASAAALFLMAAELAVRVFEARPHAPRPALASAKGPRHAPG